MIDMLLDVGQTSARARLVVNDEVVGEVEDLPGFVSGGDVRESIRASVVIAAGSLGAPCLDRVAAGCSGLFGVVPGIDVLGTSLHESHRVTSLRVADDGVTAFLGALGGRMGAMAAAGTGIVALAVGPSGAARADGVGAMLGDNGSGWWIGRAGLIAALSAADGRPVGSPVLLDAAVHRFGPISEMPIVIASSVSPIAATASFAIDVAAAARSGDAVAGRIWREAAGHIADAITAAASRAGLGPELNWSTVGRVALSRGLLEPALSTRLLERFPQAQWHAPIGDPLEGIRQFVHLTSLDDFGLMAAEYVSESAKAL
jgi:glucosamine kinase